MYIWAYLIRKLFIHYRDVCYEAGRLIRRLLDLQYKAEVNIPDQENLLVDAMILITLKSRDESVL